MCHKRMKKGAESKERAQRFVDRLALGLDQFDAQSTSLSADTASIVKACDQYILDTDQPSKLTLDIVKQKSCLYNGSTEILPEWTTKKTRITAEVNRTYAKFGEKPNKFFTEIVRQMYGDLLCNFKMEIQR
uniref:Uncharacterized protein n=1 Tax=Romanomermis culicivorax TaxID=13658 RepID=A0A915INI7_ROMCU